MLQQLFVFPCEEWLQYDSKLGGLDNCKRELLWGAASAASGLVTYKVRSPAPLGPQRGAQGQG